MIVTVVALCSTAVLAQSNIDPAAKRAWGENIGWTNWRDAGSPAGAAGARLHDAYLSGFVWSENVGWINLGDGAPANGAAYANLNGADCGVNVDPATGMLSGVAWGENIGWINFSVNAGDPLLAPGFDCDGRLWGMVWGENVGWINLGAIDAGKFVALDDATRPHPCDMNHDGWADGDDIQRFVDIILTGGDLTWQDVCAGDVQPSPDGDVTAADLAEFVDCLLN
jgi:hypothetical protein